ncbi:hypothetical protein GGI15_003432 [Coemansia interrupta]|uniref:Uncharacterized protein n=1 Tax=Coemansia interrupta TaxID=1126814 RepID=A0A9W8LGJ9_9FUNG|nr:hypothetical protein GGI15_003432 [Coemansia interrupta]
MSREPDSPGYQLDEASRAIASLCSNIRSSPEDSMNTEQQAKRRRTDSKATDPESSAKDPLSIKQSPLTARRTPSDAHSLPSIRSPATPAVQNLHIQQPPQHTYYQEALDTGIYHSQNHTPQSHLSVGSQPANTPTTSVSGIGTQQARYFGTVVPQTQQQPRDGQQFGMAAAHAASASPGMSAVISSATTLNPPRSSLSQQFATPPAIPATLLAQSSAVSNSDYNMWFYSQQQQQQHHQVAAAAAAAADRSASVATASAAVGGMAGSASVSPISQHAVASADHQYPIQGHFDSQMRYMAVPGQMSSAMPKPFNSASTSLERPIRGSNSASVVGAASTVLQSYHHYQSAAAHPQYANYYNTHHHSQQQHQHQQQVHQQTPPYQYQATHYYHHHHHQQQQAHQQPTQPHQQSTHAHQYQSPGQHSVHSQMASAFPTPASAMSAAVVAAAIGDGSSDHASLANSVSSSVLQSGAYAVVHTPTDQVSAAQVAAAVAAATASVHSHPAVGSGVAGSTVPIMSSGSTPGSVVSRLGIGYSDIDQSGIPAFKFAVNMQPGSDTSIPEYFENYTQSYMASAAHSHHQQQQQQQTQQLPPPLPMIEPSPSSPTEQILDHDLIVQLDKLFMRYLEQICSNNITVDSEGESIHQTQMAKKLEKLEQCTEFRTFRFRIQAFSNGYREFIEREAGMTEQVVSKQQLRNYLHQQRYISRYNEDGKKAKSKGHHVWNVEAKKISRNTWWFKEFLRRIASPPPKAVINVPYEWTPTIWDPQIKAPKVYFNSEWLPAWLQWDNNTLRGLPPHDATDCTISVVASYYQGKEIHHLKTNFTIHVMTHTPTTTVYM